MAVIIKSTLLQAIAKVVCEKVNIAGVLFDNANVLCVKIKRKLFFKQAVEKVVDLGERKIKL